MVEDVSNSADPSAIQQAEVLVKGANENYNFSDVSSTNLTYRNFSEQYKDTSIICFDEAKENLTANEAVIDLWAYSENNTTSRLCNSVSIR